MGRLLALPEELKIAINVIFFYTDSGTTKIS
jgi:hypothetical protein